TDRNRTSPFAITGNKFEFRMIGSYNSIAGCNTVLNTAVAESLRQFADILEVAEDFHTSLNTLIRDTIKKHKRIIFNGNGYDDAWIREATEERGLLNLKTTPDALPYYLAAKNIRLYTMHNVYTETEMRSRYEIMLENYSKTINIEAATMVDMVRKGILPAITSYSKEICETGIAKKSLGVPADYELGLAQKLTSLSSAILSGANDLENEIREAAQITDVTNHAFYMRDKIVMTLETLRLSVDEAESLVATKYWPYPTYSDLLFGVR
ncbi:MAG: glutamine synthetase type III, partial [Clostridia bacterium]|nr:glutamine synthetase type III [Clostridia bacterium]